jgi:hypothetical protein
MHGLFFSTVSLQGTKRPQYIHTILDNAHCDHSLMSYTPINRLIILF